MAGANDHDRGEHANNLGLLRVLFAVFVVISHAPQFVDGNQSREVLMRLFGTINLGELAVDGFFFVSGYLVTGSFRRSRTFGGYLRKRALRIYPGFAVASLVSVLVVAPLVGGDLSANVLMQVPVRIALLIVPDVPGAFAGMPIPILNGAMWSIPCEFACYLLLGALSCGGFLRHPRRYCVLLATLGACVVVRWLVWPDAGEYLSPSSMATISVRLLFVFGSGSLFYLCRDRIALTPLRAGTAAILLIAALFFRPLVEPAVVLCGGYLVLWFGLAVRPSRVALAMNRVDISYGLYLYAWPVMNLFVHAYPETSPWLAAAVTLVAAGLLGLASWHFVERPALAWRTMPSVRPDRLAGAPVSV